MRKRTLIIISTIFASLVIIETVFAQMEFLGAVIGGVLGFGAGLIIGGLGGLVVGFFVGKMMEWRGICKNEDMANEAVEIAAFGISKSGRRIGKHLVKVQENMMDLEKERLHTVDEIIQEFHRHKPMTEWIQGYISRHGIDKSIQQLLEEMHDEAIRAVEAEEMEQERLVQEAERDKIATEVEGEEEIEEEEEK